MSNDAETFDFIVTGAGSAGCCVAAPAQRIGRYRVLLLEAGTRRPQPLDPRPDRLHPDCSPTRASTGCSRASRSRELNGRTMYQPRGKVLGGTSSINGMVYMRGTPADYDGWRQRGCDGWDWDSVLPFFKKAEDQERGADEFHGVGGPLRVSDPVRSALGRRVGRRRRSRPACRPTTISTAASRKASAITRRRPPTARRWSTATAYLRPARNRANLAVAHQRARHPHRCSRTAGPSAVEFRTPAGRA